MSRHGRWLGFALFLGVVLALIGLGRSLRIGDDEESSLRSDQAVTVRRDDAILAFLPATAPARTALIFICGSDVAAEGYAALLRPVANAGYPVLIVRLPYRRAFLHIHQPIVFDRVRQVIAVHPDITNWVLSGHSLGGALSVLFAHAELARVAGLVLIATTYPTDVDLSSLRIPVTQIYASRDGLAGPEKAMASRRLLPAHTRSVEIDGGNHAQFGRYGEQAFDGVATISREEQEALTRAEIIRLLAEVDSRR
jgi:pimeloyl-ACP methyl ester carboxylesterase